MPELRHLWLIVNGKVAGDEVLREKVAALRGVGHRVDVRVTWERGDGRRLTSEGLEAAAEVLVVCGGDGTVNEVASTVLDSSRDATLAIVPMGTANDLATAGGIPDEVSAALDLAARGKPTRIDAGRVNGRWFVNAATGGFGSRVTAATPVGLKRALGDLAYVLTGLTRFGDLRPEEGSIHGDGFDFEGPFWGLAVCNGPLAGPQVAVRPEARVDDGLLDVAVLPRLEADGRRLALEEFGRTGFDALEQVMATARVERLTVELGATLDLNLDGEPVEDREFEITVAAGALSCILPEGCPLLTGDDSSASS